MSEDLQEVSEMTDFQKVSEITHEILKLFQKHELSLETAASVLVNTLDGVCSIHDDKFASDEGELLERCVYALCVPGLKGARTVNDATVFERTMCAGKLSKLLQHVPEEHPVMILSIADVLNDEALSPIDYIEANVTVSGKKVVLIAAHRNTGDEGD